MTERIGDHWQSHKGHVARYEYAAKRILPHESVKDVACGIGYGSSILNVAEYTGYDKPGVPWAAEFSGLFLSCDLNAPTWAPTVTDVSVCFETLEHVQDPLLLAWRLGATTRRAIGVSAPTVPTKDTNPYHLHDFTEADIPPLFEGFRVVEDWAQPEELAHVWWLERG